MKERVKSFLMMVLLLTPLIALGGCATTSELNNTNATANAALNAANKAQATANEALQKAIEAEKIANEAKAASEKSSRMFQKSLQK